MNVVVRHIDRASTATIERLAVAGVATVHEAQGRTGLLDPNIRPVWAGARIAGSAVTVSCHPGDNLMIHLAIECLSAGDVLVVTTTSRSTDGMIGELIAASMRYRGVAGLITDAGVRDVADLTSMRFPVWSRAISAQGTVKASPGSVNVPVVCAGRLVHPGDVIVADDDGVVCVPRATADEVATRAEQRIAKEAETRQQLTNGVLGADLYGLRAKAAELGIVYLDRADDETG
ncbi:MAG: 4-carboxy-4-hydroxy-2-oxoadipate aldolase/oxaloacetate decarboxylase [Ilumatobacteraceae bacterium]